MKNQDIEFTQIPTEAGSYNADAQGDVQQPLTAIEIQSWLVSYLAELLTIDSYEVDVDIPFERYGLDSYVVVGLIGDLEEWLGCELDPTLAYDYPTVEALARHLSQSGKVKEKSIT